MDVWHTLSAEGDTPPALVVGGDTVVSMGAKILEKPRDRAEAVEMLTELSGTTHTVWSGVALVHLPSGGSKGPSVVVFAEKTEVTFADLPAATIEAYVNTGEPMDKAGGYGIQAAGGQFVAGISGCFYNVMGFPMHKFAANLARLVDAGFVVSEQ